MRVKYQNKNCPEQDSNPELFAFRKWSANRCSWQITLADTSLVQYVGNIWSIMRDGSKSIIGKGMMDT